MGRAGWWRRAAERCLEAFEEAGERVGFGGWQIGKQSRESFAEGGLRRTKCPLALFCQGEWTAAEVFGGAISQEESGLLEGGEHLRDGGG